jgi:hypothetical protein
MSLLYDFLIAHFQVTDYFKTIMFDKELFFQIKAVVVKN